ncbi:hypothetical protein K502DRAFT_325405 [Neoconidiobolus thromboides FSU 785]|nr:hypothetical protein K502DRAFT_325405 [Neoconidiobolus thromboides FSU 785]
MSNSNPDKALYLAFKKATQTLSNLYRQSQQGVDNSYCEGYKEALIHFIKIYKGLNHRTIRTNSGNQAHVNGNELIKRMLEASIRFDRSLEFDGEQEVMNVNNVVDSPNIETPREFKRHLGLLTKDIIENHIENEFKKKRVYRKKDDEEDSLF